jgi:periplasmic divalent cation tolerance protein
VVESKLSACVNIIENLNSVYFWQGKVIKDEEFLLIIKTRKNRIKEIEKIISQNHNYQLPEFVWFEIGGGSKQFLKWLGENTR